jgi:DNA-binding transcriptional LysR family regulator
MKIIQLKYFAAIVEHGGFVAASKALHVAQPALSRQINDLEYELKTRLLDRGRQGSKLTDSGRNFYNRVRFILEQVEIAKKEAGSRERNPVGEVKVALPVTMSDLLAPELVRRVEKNYPLVSVSMIDGTGQITPRYEQQSLLTILSLVRFALASSVLNWLAVRNLWEAGIVNVRRIVKPDLVRVISIAVPANRPLTVAAQAVYEILQELVVCSVEKGDWKGRIIAFLKPEIEAVYDGENPLKSDTAGMRTCRDA